MKRLDSLDVLDAREISLVNRGANKKKRFPIFKSEDGNMDMEEILKMVLESEADGEGKFDEVLKAAKVSDKGRVAAQGALRILAAFTDELPAGIVEQLEEVAKLKKAEPKKTDKTKKTEFGYPASDEDIQKWHDGMPDDLKKVIKIEKKEPPVKKGLENLPPDAQGTVETLMKAHDDKVAALEAKNEAVEKSLKAVTDARETEQWVKKAQELSHYPGKSIEEMGAMLKKLNDVDPKMAEEQFETMKSASEAIEKSALMTSAGAHGYGSNAGSAMEKIDKMAKGLVEKSEDLKMTHAKAVTEVLDSRPDLYDAYMAENSAQTGNR